MHRKQPPAEYQGGRLLQIKTPANTLKNEIKKELQSISQSTTRENLDTKCWFQSEILNKTRRCKWWEIVQINTCKDELFEEFTEFGIHLDGIYITAAFLLWLLFRWFETFENKDKYSTTTSPDLSWKQKLKNRLSEFGIRYLSIHRSLSRDL